MIVIVGSRDTAERAATLLGAGGEEARAHVVIDTAAVAAPAEVKRALAELGPEGWVALASRAAARHLREIGGPLPAGVRCVVQGPGTAEAARAAGFAVGLEAAEGTAEGLARAFMAAAPAPGPGVLQFAARGGRTAFRDRLREAGYRAERFVLYRTFEVEASRRGDLPGGSGHAFAFASPSAVRAFLRVSPLPPGARTVAFGPTTAAAMAATGVSADHTLREHSLAGLLEVFS